MSRLFVALATYNGEKYLELFLRSLIDQTLKADQIIAVDDASSDGSVAILERYAKTLPIQIIRQKNNQGHRASFERALEEIHKQKLPGDFVALADQDDVWLPNKLFILNQKIKEADLIFGDAEVIDEEGNVIHSSWRSLAFISPSQPFLAHIAGINNVSGCLSLFKADLLDDLLPIPKGVSVHDRWLAIFAEKRKGVKAISDLVVQYRLHEENAVGLKKNSSMAHSILVNINWLKMLIDEANRIPLTKDEVTFTTALLDLQMLREKQMLVPSYLLWVWGNRNILFFNSNSLKEKIKKTLFSVVGLPFARQFLRKS